jgi:hypothetical protein
MQIIKNRQFALYTKGAAAQFKMAKINDKIDATKAMQGWHLFVDAAKVLPGAEGSNNRSYDWKNKITMRLSIPDLGVFLNGIRTKFDPGTDTAKPKEYKIFHDPFKGGERSGQVAKSMSISRGQSYGYMMNFRQTKDGQTNSFAVPLTDEQLVIMNILFTQATILVAGWVEDGEIVVEKEPAAV